MTSLYLQWQEASSPHEDGVERRVLMVCRMQKVKQNNWVRSPFISVRGASRIYVEFEFTMRYLLQLREFILFYPEDVCRCDIRNVSNENTISICMF